jgi:stage II sporulation protein D
MYIKSPKTFWRILLLSILLIALEVLSTDSLYITHAIFENHAPQAEPSVRIGVLGLFHAQEFILSVTDGQALVLRTNQQSIVLESSGIRSATARLNGSQLAITCGSQILRAPSIQVAGREDQPVDFTLEIPGKIIRHYRGLLEIKSAPTGLSAVVTLDLETAVASVVAAENSPDTPLEALKANAIAARSYFVAARGRHREFDFCDTTHCQFLRTPPPPESLPSKAAADTRSLVLSYQGRRFAAMYTRSCSGRTRTPYGSGLPNTAYPYYPVLCTHCRLHPARWTSRISAQEESWLQAGNEKLRLAVDHRLGWGAVPSNDFSLQREGDSLLLRGVGNGHGIGLCQAGAKAMAQAGANFRDILDHYYPNANVVSYPGWN